MNRNRHPQDTPGTPGLTTPIAESGPRRLAILTLDEVRQEQQARTEAARLALRARHERAAARRERVNEAEHATARQMAAMIQAYLETVATPNGIHGPAARRLQDRLAWLDSRGLTLVHALRRLSAEVDG